MSHKMSVKGVTEAEETIIKNIIAPLSETYDFYYYGSRVKGNFRQLSDLDLMIKGEKEAPSNIISKLKNDFDSSFLPYVVNIADFYTLNENFYNIIKDDLVKVI